MIVNELKPVFDEPFNIDYAHSRILLVPDAKILTLLEQHAVEIHKQIECLTKHNESLTKARDLLLPRLMNGEIAA
jgi:type I restriction enzyme S subunit